MNVHFHSHLVVMVGSKPTSPKTGKSANPVVMRVDGITKGLNPIFCSTATECPITQDAIAAQFEKVWALIRTRFEGTKGGTYEVPKSSLGI